MSCKTPNKQTEDTDAAEDRHVLNFKIRLFLGCQDMWEQQQTPYNEGVQSFKTVLFLKIRVWGFFQRHNAFLRKLLLDELLQEQQGSHWTTSHHPLGWCKMTSVVPQGPGKGKVSQSLPSIVTHSIRELLTNCC